MLPIFDFPLSLLWGVAVAYLYRTNYSILALWAISIAAIAASFFLSLQYSFSFWAPGGMACVILGSVLAIQLSRFNNSKKEIVALTLPTRKQIKDTMVSTNDREERQQLYVNLVREFSSKFKSKITVLTRVNTYLLLGLFAAIFIFNFTYIYTQLIMTGEFARYLEKSIDTLAKAMQTPISAENKKKSVEVILAYYPGISFILNAVYQLILLFFLKRVNRVRPDGLVSFGELYLFRMPDIFVWLFIITAGLVLASGRIEIGHVYQVIIGNALLILTGLYVFQGLGVAVLYLQVRLLPAGWVIASAFIFGLIVYQVFFFVVLV